MGSQVGISKFTGQVGDVIGFKKKNGEYGVKKKPKKVPKSVRQNAPQYEETRKNEGEFGVASQGGQLFRQAMMHITHRWTDWEYPPKVMQAMVQTLRADNKHIKGEKTLNTGLKNAVSQMVFKRLAIYQKKYYEHFRGSLMVETADPHVWKLNHQVLWRKRDDGDTKSVKIGFLHIDFDGKIAKYEDAFSITCKRNEKITFSEHNIVPSSDINTPWTFIIMQVWRDGEIREPTGMLFMNVLQVIGAGCIEAEVVEEQGLHTTEPGGLDSNVVIQEKRIIDENGVNWDVVLDLCLDQGFEQWDMGDEAEELHVSQMESEIEVSLGGSLYEERETELFEVVNAQCIGNQRDDDANQRPYVDEYEQVKNAINDVLYYYHSDHIGSSTFLTDALGYRYEFIFFDSSLKKSNQYIAVIIYTKKY